MSISLFYIIVIIFKLIVITVETLFILLVVNGNTYMNTYTNTSIITCIFV